MNKIQQNYTNLYAQHLQNKMQYKNNIKKDNVVNQNAKNTIKNNKPSFSGKLSSALSYKGASFLRFLATNMAWGAVFIDFFCMDAPRTIVDCGRGLNAGAETGIREGSGTANHSLIGTYGLGAASIAALALNKKYGVKANNIFASNDTIDVLGNFWHEELKAKAASTPKDKEIEKPLGGFLRRVFADVEGYAPGKEKSEWKKLPKESQELLQNKFEVYINKSLNEGVTKADSKELKSIVQSIFGSKIGTNNTVRFATAKTKVEDAMHSDTLVSNVTKLAKAFMSDKVHKEFLKSDKFDANGFIKGLKHLNKNVSIAGMTIAALIGMSIQPLNRYRTKLKTGKDDFVGGGKPDKTNKFKLFKLISAGAFAAAAFATITTKPAKLLEKLQFKGFTPTIDQFKFIYGVTIASRLAVARTKDEWRESALKDTLGFANWLILGNFVSIGVAKLFEKYSHIQDNNFLKYHNPDKKNWLLHSNVLSMDEVLHKALKKAGIDTIKADGKAMSFKEMWKALPKRDLETKSKLKSLMIIQLAGYVYSGLVLGIGIPKMNIAIKKYKDKKRAAEAQKLQPSA